MPKASQSWRPALSKTTDGVPLFRAIVQALSDDIAAGRLAAGARLPPHRALADELGVARGTVARAYQEAEQLGLIRGAVGSGTRVLASDGGARPYANLLQAPTALRDLSTNLPLSGIDPDPRDVLRQLAERPDRKQLLRYHSPLGLQRHRAAGSQWLRRMGVKASADDVLLCAGAQHALFVIASHARRRGRALYVEELTYPGMHGIAEALDVPLIPIALDDEGMHPASLDRACRSHGPGMVFCMPTIHNPTGAVMSTERRAALAEVARKRDLVVIEDAANRMLMTRPPPPLRHFAPERTFLVASVSKVLAPGLRTAFVVGPVSDLAPLARLVWATQWMTGALGPEMVALWLESKLVDGTLRRKRREAARRQALARRIFGDAARGHPQALHVWLSLPGPWQVERFVAEAAQHQLVVTPSSAFWIRTTRAPAAVRIALGGVDAMSELELALEKLAALLPLGGGRA